MELRHLRYFVAVAEELNFSRAAERLHISQPPLSQQIRQLEADLDVELFRRTKRQVTLTHAGEVFLIEARAVLERTWRARTRAQRAAEGELGELTIGFVGSATYAVLPRIVSAFRDDFPDVKLHLEELTTTQQVKALMDGRIQAGLIRPSPRGEGIEWEVIASEPMVLALPPRHRLADSGGAVHLREVAEDPFILFPRPLGPSFYDQIIAACHAAGFSPEIAQEAIQMQTIVGLVAAGLGIAVVPASMRHFRTESVLYKSITDDVPTIEMAVMWRTRDRSPVLRQFLDAARRYMLDVNP